MTAPEGPRPIPDSYRRVTPCLTVHGAAKALEFYTAVFDATERMRFPGAGRNHPACRGPDRGFRGDDRGRGPAARD